MYCVTPCAQAVAESNDITATDRIVCSGKLVIKVESDNEELLEKSAMFERAT
jgi:hypothetical protein